MNQKGFALIPLLIISVLLVISAGAGVYLRSQRVANPEPIEPDDVVCTQDAKECPDGSFVGRTGPNCEFEACPGGAAPTSTEQMPPSDYLPSTPRSVSEKFKEVEAKYQSSLGSELFYCSKSDHAMFVISGSGGFSGTILYYDIEGKELAHYDWVDYGGYKEPFDRSKYICTQRPDPPNPGSGGPPTGTPTPTQAAILTPAPTLSPSPSVAPTDERDRVRVTNLESMRGAINNYLAMATMTPMLCAPKTIYASTKITPPAGWQYGGDGLGVDGTGWIPVRLIDTPGGSPIAQLFKDPISDPARHLMYAYVCDQTHKTFELNANLEGAHSNGGTDDSESTDGGDNLDIYEAGNDPGLNLIPNEIWSGAAERDSRRISDLRTIQSMLEVYYGASGFYPRVTDFVAMATAIGVSPVGVRPSNDPLGGTATYVYACDPSGATCQSYVLKATLEDAQNSALNLPPLYDVDGVVYGVNCEDPAYCVKL